MQARLALESQTIWRAAGHFAANLRKLKDNLAIIACRHAEHPSVCVPAAADLPVRLLMLPVVVDVEFVTEFGDLPMLTTDVSLLGGNVTITRRVKGTRLNLECSMLGNCDEDTGRCKCLPGYGTIATMGSMFRTHIFLPSPLDAD